MRFEGINPQRPADQVDFSDLTDSVQVEPAEWDPRSAVATLVVPMDREPAPDEALAIRRRLVTADAADEAHLYDLLAAYADPTAPAWAKTILSGELAKYGETV